MNTNLELYKVFYEVVKYKNISKTAESMYISQSAITQSIQKLENILGGKVFYRNKNGVELTEEGKNLYEYIKNSIETMNNAENIFSKYINLEKGKIRIGGGNSLLSSLIFEPLLEFIKEYPDIEVSIGSGITDVLMQKLANGELDIVVLNLPYKDKKYSNIEIIPLKDSSFSFFASKQYLEKNPIKDFKEIENLSAGDPVYLTNPWEKLTYRVESVAIIAPTDSEKLKIQEGKNMVTLITCHPYRSHGKQRYVVYCVRDTTTSGTEQMEAGTKWQNQKQQMADQQAVSSKEDIRMEDLTRRICAVLILGCALIAFISNRKLKKRERSEKTG